MAAVRQDFPRPLREDAEFKAEVRREVLTDELLNPPETFAGMNARRDSMSGLFDRIIVLLENIDARLKRIESDLAELKGDILELKMANRIVPFISGKLELRAGRIVRGGQPTDASIAFDDLLYDAYEGGAIDARERERLNATDLIISAVSRKSKARAYVAVEASYVVDVRDAARARSGADILAKAFPDAEAYPAVYGRNVNPEGRAAADRLGVSIYAAPRDESANPH